MKVIISALELKGKLESSQSKQGIGNFTGIVVPKMLFDWITSEIWLTKSGDCKKENGYITPNGCLMAFQCMHLEN